jgi:hypothetical protein
MEGQFVNDEMKRICDETVVVQFNVLSQHLSGGIGKPRNTSFKIAGLRAEFLISDF